MKSGSIALERTGKWLVHAVMLFPLVVDVETFQGRCQLWKIVNAMQCSYQSALCMKKM
jgi:hypothetical protein